MPPDGRGRLRGGAERAVVLLINCCRGEDRTTIVRREGAQPWRDGRGGEDRERTEAVAATPRGAAPCILSLVADDPATRAAGETARRRLRLSARAVFACAESASESDSVPVSVVAAVAANGLCVDDVPNKEAFLRAGGIPPLMALLGGEGASAKSRGKGKDKERARVLPVITRTSRT